MLVAKGVDVSIWITVFSVLIGAIVGAGMTEVSAVIKAAVFESGAG